MPIWFAFLCTYVHIHVCTAQPQVMDLISMYKDMVIYMCIHVCVCMSEYISLHFLQWSYNLADLDGCESSLYIYIYIYIYVYMYVYICMYVYISIPPR
jgi:hypothetical protein